MLWTAIMVFYLLVELDAFIRYSDQAGDGRTRNRSSIPGGGKDFSL